jgi:hypothetical protein
MFAIVTKYDKFPHSRRYRVEFLDPVCRISIGSKISRRRLERLLKPFGGRVLFAENITPHRIKQFDTSALRRSVLFCQFYDRVMSKNGISLSVGVVDTAGDFLNRREMTEIIAHSASTTVFTFKNMDDKSHEWLLATGTCPEIVEKKTLLYATDVTFAPEGLLGYEGELFGLGGNGIDREKLYIPDEVRQFLSDSFNQLDKVDLYCMLKNEGLGENVKSATAMQKHAY